MPGHDRIKSGIRFMESVFGNLDITLGLVKRLGLDRLRLFLAKARISLADDPGQFDERILLEPAVAVIRAPVAAVVRIADRMVRTVGHNAEDFPAGLDRNPRGRRTLLSSSHLFGRRDTQQGQAGRKNQGDRMNKTKAGQR